MKREKKLLERVGKKIRKFRKERGYTQEILAEKSDINAKYLGRIERSESSVSLVTLSKICKALGTSLSQFLAFSNINGELGELSSEIWELIKRRDKETIELSIRVLKEILNGIGALQKASLNH